MQIDKQELIYHGRDWLFITIGAICYAIGYVCFLLPYHITTGGAAGVASVVFFATGFQPQYTYLLINIFLLILALKILGIKFLVNTIYGVLSLSTAIAIGQELVMVNGELPKILGDQSFMACVMGPAIEGIGLGIVFLNNGSTGGTDIIAACINKYRNFSLGQILLFFDIIIVSSHNLVFHQLDLLLYGFCAMIVETYMLDYMMNTMRQSVQFIIISQHYEEIAKAINDTGRGVTMLDGMGWYTRKSKKVLLVLARRRESTNIFRAIKSIDSNAFVSQSKVIGVFGEGFEKMKGK